MAGKTTAARTSAPEGRLIRLRWFNIVMGGLHLVQGLTMLALASDFALPVTSAFLRFDPRASVLRPELETVFRLRIGPVVAAFLLLSALAHLLVSSPRIYDWYANNLRQGINPARWMEYSLSSSIMIVAIAMLVGIYDVAALLLLFGLNASMILFGWLMEVDNSGRDPVRWLAYWFGVFAGAVPWIAVGIYLIGAGAGDQGPPTFVYFVYGSIFLFFNVFALNMALQYLRVGRWQDYLHGERVYMLLSLFAKSALAWQVFGGTLRPL